MKRLLTIGASVLLLASCSTATSVQPSTASTEPKQLNIETALSNSAALTSVLMDSMAKAKQIQQQQRKIRKQIANAGKIQTLLNKVQKHEGKTWYVFSGASPRGWDCSGLVRWAYGQVGVTLDHSATKQMRSGTVVKKPVAGDIVAYYYGNGSRSFHVGLYVGNGKMIHSYYAGTRTRIDSVAGVARANRANFKYVRILSTLPTAHAALNEGRQLAKVEQPRAAWLTRLLA